MHAPQEQPQKHVYIKAPEIKLYLRGFLQRSCEHPLRPEQSRPSRWSELTVTATPTSTTTITMATATRKNRAVARALEPKQRQQTQNCCLILIQNAILGVKRHHGEKLDKSTKLHKNTPSSILPAPPSMIVTVRVVTHTKRSSAGISIFGGVIAIDHRAEYVELPRHVMTGAWPTRPWWNYLQRLHGRFGVYHYTTLPLESDSTQPE